MAVGCDAQVDSAYVGDPLAEVLGTINNEMKSPPNKAAAGLVWFKWVNAAGRPDSATGEQVPVAARFPANFGIKLYAPPPAEMLNDFTLGGRYPNESRIGMGIIVVGSEDLLLLQDDPGSTWGGVAEDYVLAYLADDVEAGTHTEAFVHGRLESGYHILQVKRQTEAEIEMVSRCKQAASTPEAEHACGIESDQLFFEAPQGLRTRIPVRLVDDPTTLTVPDLK